MDYDFEDAVRIETFVTSGDGPSCPCPLPLDVTQYWTAPSNFGGPIAYVPRCSDTRPHDAAIIFTTSTGKFLSHHTNEQLLEMDADNTIAMVDWSERQTLVILYRDGQAIFYHGPMDQKPYINCLAMLSEGDSVLMGIMGSGALSFVTSNLCLFVSTNIDQDDPDAIAYNELSYLDSTRPPLCLTLLNNNINNNNNNNNNFDDSLAASSNARNNKPRIILPCIGMGIIVVDADKETPDVHTIDAWHDNTIVAMSSHPTTNHICLCTENLMASVHLLDNHDNTFDTLMQVQINNDVMGNAFCVPKELGWLPRGENIRDGFMVLSFEKPPWCPDGWGIIIIDSKNNYILRDYADCIEIKLVQEVDGIHVIVIDNDANLNEADELLRAVPVATMNIFSPGSLSPGAMLKDAKNALNERDPRCNEHILELKNGDSLDTAIESCIDGCKFERDLSVQLSLVESATYGARFLMDSDDQQEILDDIHELCKILRIVHICKTHIGMSLTVRQYESISSECIIARMALWNYHSIALQMCSTLRISGNNIAEHWSCEKIRNSKSDVSDDVLYNIIKGKLPGNSYSSASSNHQQYHTNANNGNSSGVNGANSNGRKSGSETKNDTDAVVGSPGRRFRSSGDLNSVERALNGLIRSSRPASMKNSHHDKQDTNDDKTNNQTAKSTTAATTTLTPQIYPKASLVPAAKQAIECHRPLLARKLLSLEPVLTTQVNALVYFDLLDEAFNKLALSHDTDLMYYMLMQSKKGLQWGQFFELISRHPQMRSLMLLYWKSTRQETYILQFLKQTPAHMTAGKYMMQQAMAMVDPMKFDERHKLLQMSAKAFECAGPEGKSFVEVVEDRIKLEQAQRQLSPKLVGKSLRKTIFDAVRRQE